MNRSERREQVFRILFRCDFFPEKEYEEQAGYYFAPEENVTPDDDDDTPLPDGEDAAQILEKCRAIWAKRGEIDEMINARAVGWTTERMGKVDVAILRLAVYEILFDEEVPTGVAINEAVELAKKYGQDESSSFINGVLAKFA